MLRDRLRQTENDLDMTKVQMEKALKERALLDNKLGMMVSKKILNVTTFGSKHFKQKIINKIGIFTENFQPSLFPQ